MFLKKNNFNKIQIRLTDDFLVNIYRNNKGLS